MEIPAARSRPHHIAGPSRPANASLRRRPAALSERGIAAKITTTWGCSSAGRASRSQCEGREFDPPQLHQHTLKARSCRAFCFSRRLPEFDVLLARIPRHRRMPTPLKLLILEDNAFDAELEVGKLQAAGYDCAWTQVETREEFEAHLERSDFDLILADYNLPSFDGLSALRLLRERGLDIPFVLISGTLGEERAIESVKAGATDYVMKERLERLAPAVTRALNDRLERASRRAAQQALSDAHPRLQSPSVRRRQVEETERRRIARDLHDGVGQLLTAVKLRLAGLNPASTDYGPRRAECVAALDEALEPKRRASSDRRHSQLDGLGPGGALRPHLDRL